MDNKNKEDNRGLLFLFLLMIGGGVYLLTRGKKVIAAECGTQEDWFCVPDPGWIEVPDIPGIGGIMPSLGCSKYLSPPLEDVRTVRLKAEPFMTDIDNHRKPFDRELIMAIIAIESMFNPKAQGRANEYGLMQIKASTAQQVGFKGDPSLLFNPALNIFYGTKYLRWQYERYDGNLEYAIAAYNSGTLRFLGLCPSCKGKDTIVYDGILFRCLSCKDTWNSIPFSYVGLQNHNYFCKVWLLYQALKMYV